MSGELSATLDELVATFQRLFPREHQVAFLTLANEKQAERILELEHGAAEDGQPSK